MYHLKGFCVISSLVSNAPDKVSPIGEPSDFSLSFSRNKGYFHFNELSNITLVTFSSKEDATTIEPPSDVVKRVVKICDWITVQITNNAVGLDKSQLTKRLATQFTDSAKEFAINTITTHNSTNTPEQVSWKDSKGGLITIWFTDNSFQRDYDEYEIITIPPLPNVNDLHDTKSNLSKALGKETVNDVVKRINTAVGKNPATAILSEDYRWYETGNPANTLVLTWNAVVYGNAGQQADNIKNAFIKQTLDKSSYDRTAWSTIIPELFNPTEFYITPLWDRVAIKQVDVKKGIYSPTQKVNEIMAVANRTFVGYPAKHISKYTTISGSLYKSVPFIAIGNAGNQDGIITFDAKFPDYCVLPQDDLDFDRISPNTQEWIRQFIGAAAIAEIWKKGMELPSNLSTSTRKNTTFIRFKFLGTDYLITTKESYNE